MNKLIIGTRGQGKTSRLIEECFANPGSIIVCPNPASAKFLMQQALKRRLDIPMPITFHQYVNNYLRGTRYTALYFDEVQLCLQNLGIPVAGMTVDITDSQIEVLHNMV